MTTKTLCARCSRRRSMSPAGRVICRDAGEVDAVLAGVGITFNDCPHRKRPERTPSAPAQNTTGLMLQALQLIAAEYAQDPLKTRTDLLEAEDRIRPWFGLPPAVNHF